MTAPADRGLPGRVGWHARLAWRASRWTVLAAGALGVLLRLVLPIDEAWLAGAVALATALLALALLALAESRSPPLGPPPPDVSASLERLGTPDLLAHALARTTLVLGAFAVGLALGAALGLGPGRP